MSRRRRQQKLRSSWQDSQQIPQCPDGWPDAAAIREVVDLDPLTSRLLEHVTADDVFDLMQRIPAEFRQLMLREIGLLTVSSINRGMAGQVLARIRRDAHPAASPLLNMLTQPITSLLLSELTVDEWAALLGEDNDAALVTFAEHQHAAELMNVVAQQIGPALRAVGLVSAIAAEVAASAVAVTLLAADDERCADAHRRLSHQYPRLPAVPRLALAGLAPAGRLEQAFPADMLDGIDLTDPDQLAVQLDRHHAEVMYRRAMQTDHHEPEDSALGWAGADDLEELVTAAASDEGSRSAARERLLSEISGILDRWDEVVGSAEAIRAAAHSGQLWDRSQLDVLIEFEEWVQAVADHVATMLGTPVQPSRSGLTDAASKLHAEARSSVAWLHALTEIKAPPAVNGAADAVRVLARQALDLERHEDDNTLVGLRALYTIVVSGMRSGTVHDIDYAELTSADRTLRENLPPAMPLILPAGRGDVTVPMDDIVEPAADCTAETVGGAHTELPRDDGAPGVDPHSELRSDPHGEAPGDVPSRDPDTGKMQEDGKTENRMGVVTKDAVVTKERGDDGSAQPAGHAVVATADTRTDNSGQRGDESTGDDDRALAQLLDGGAAQTLSALTGARRRAAVVTSVQTGEATEPEARPTGVDSPSDPASARSDGQLGDLPEGGQHPQLTELLPQLLHAGRYGLAADLLEAGGESPATVAARRLVAYAGALRHPTGEIASAFARTAEAVNRDRLADDRAGQLLAWAAAARISVLSPSASPARLLLNLAPVVSGCEALVEVGQALLDASRSGVVVLPEAAGAVGSLAAQEKLAADLAQEAADLLAAANTRTIKYAPANGVVQAWMSSTGPLGALLGTVAGNDRAATGSVRDSVVELRDRGDRTIDETFGGIRRRGSNRKIIAGARASLNARWDEAVDLASRWADAAERAADLRDRLRAGVWQAKPLHTLSTRLAAVREEALNWLAADLDPTQGDDYGYEQLAPARQAAAEMLRATIDICAGQAQTGDEPPAPFVAHAELLATDLPLDARTLLPDGGLTPGCLPALTSVGAAARATVMDLYAHRAGRGDHDLTGVLVASVRATEPATARALDRRRVDDVASEAANIAAAVRQITDEIDSQRMAGGLDDGPWSSLSSRVLPLEQATRSDFGRIRAEVDQIRAQLTTHRQRKIDETVARINARAADDRRVAAAADRLLEFARSGQIASAEEYLDQVASSGQLPTDTTQIDHLQRFFPAVPDLYAEHRNLTGQLRAALAGAEPTPAVRNLAAAAGTDLATLPETRRKAGDRSLEIWQLLTLGKQGGGRSDTGALRPVLSQAGLEFTEASVETTSGPGRAATGRQWVRLTGVTGTGSALVPLLGSAISPDGGTLRVLVVRNAPTPTTVLEWMHTQAPDHTVLALWLGNPLTAADRRAIADAARGRPKPPVMFLDAAALGYLVCQTEPRRGTFAATALPLSAVSPFHDRPGDAPPEMFYGRTEEIAAVLDLSGPSVLYGGRQLGKSALLRTAAARFEASGQHRHAVEQSIFTVGSEADEPDSARLWNVLWPRLAERGIVPSAPPAEELAEAVHKHILIWLGGDSSRALLVLLDEADAFLDADAAGNRFTHVDRCRRIMLDSRRRVKFVFAGLHRTARFETLPNQPLSHLGRPVLVGPLRPQHAYDLLTQPLAAMGFRFADKDAGPARVLALANNMPALLQLFGRALIAHLTSRSAGLGGPPWSITDDDIDAVISDADLQEAFRNKYQLTINLDHRYMVIAYVVAEAAHDRGIDAGLTQSELFDACQQAWPAGFAGMAVDYFRSLVTECVDLSVLAEDDGRFRIRTPTVLRLLGTEEQILDVLYNRTAELSVPSATDAASYRRPLSSNSRSPFTERQIGQLFSTGRQVLVVTGSAALGLEKAIGALYKAQADVAGRIGHIRRCHTLTEDGIRRTVGQVTGDRELLVADATKLSPDGLRSLLSAANHVVEGCSRQVTLVITAGPLNAPGWIDWPHRLELGRVDAPGLRLWCEEANLPFHDDESIAKLLAATAGWPLVVTHAARLCGMDQPVPTGARVLELTARWLAGPGALELTTSAQLDSGVLAQAHARIAALTAGRGEDLESLVELLEMDDDPGHIEREEIGRAGYTDLAQIVTTLRVLGCLVADADGCLRAEPVLAAAVQRTRS